MEMISLSASKDQSSADKKSWKCPASAKSLRTTNPIRAIVDPIVANIQGGEERGDGKDLISLALGDPTAAGNLPPCPIALDSIQEALTSEGHAAGYVGATGTPEARQAIATFHGGKMNASSVIVASGCSGALELALTALLDPGTILLVPQPGFPLYEVIAKSHGASVVHYRLDPTKNWECDLQHMEELVCAYGPQVRGILVNNPSNPTGGVFSLDHLKTVVKFAECHQLPLVADEVYGDLTFAACPFHPLADVAASLGEQVPVITASGLAKQWLVPGWRLGWLCFSDNVHGSLSEVEAGAKRLAQVVLGASHLVQRAVPTLLDNNNASLQEWKAQLRSTLEEQAKFLSGKLSSCPGLEVIQPSGAMYSLVRVNKFNNTIKSDLDFSSMLLSEENVFVLPGTAFGMPGFFRVVFCAPNEVLEKAASRINCFCERHF